MTAEIDLWKAVIKGALNDLHDPIPDVREEAEKWFNLELWDFRRICDFANVDAVFILKIFKLHKEKPLHSFNF